MNNIGVMFRQRAVVSPKLEAYVEPSTGVRVNYAQMNAQINQCVSLLRELDVCKGDRVALLMPNCLEFCCLFYATAKLGAVAVPLNTRLTAAELEFILSDSGSSVLVKRLTRSRPAPVIPVRSGNGYRLPRATARWPAG